jgi:hypothetical protein
MKGTWHFYTEDNRFEALWYDPSPIVNSGCVNVVEPNFSVFHQMPAAVALWHVYRKRWLARYWQSVGVRIFVDLNVPDPHFHLNFLGVPQAWRAYATRGYAAQIPGMIEEYEAVVAHHGSADVLYLVYGGGRAVQALCMERGWVWIDEHMNRAKQHGEE